LLAVGIVLARLVLGQDTSFNISGKVAVICAGIGAFIYALAGYLPMLSGAQFLDYTYLPIKAETVAETHALGILMIEIGVTITVMMTIIDIMDVLIRKGDLEDDE